jgi:hypothetical protein
MSSPPLSFDPVKHVNMLHNLIWVMLVLMFAGTRGLGLYNRACACNIGLSSSVQHVWTLPSV